MSKIITFTLIIFTLIMLLILPFVNAFVPMSVGTRFVGKLSERVVMGAAANELYKAAEKIVDVGVEQYNKQVQRTKEHVNTIQDGKTWQEACSKDGSCAGYI